MKFINLLIISLSTVLSGFSFAANPVPENVLTGWNTISQSTIKTNLSYFASNALEGRLALSKGDKLAVDKIVEHFKNAGLKPANSGSYLQTVKLIEYAPNEHKSFIKLDRKGTQIKWKKPDVFTDFFQDINLTADVVFAGYGITAPELHYDDYQNIDVRGKIVLVFEHEPQETNATSIFNGTGNTPYATTRVKVLNAQQHGAIGVLIAPEPNRSHPSNQQRYSRVGGSTKRKTPLPDMVLEQDERHIPYAILSDKVAKKIAGTKISLGTLQSAIDRDLKPQSQPIADSMVTIHDENLSQHVGTTYNVVGLLEGSDPLLKPETIIISAHHDHDGKVDKQIWHGADDNASGTTGVITLAKAMVANTDSENGMKPKRSILFVVFAAEERGLLGAYYMASHPLRPLETTRAMINLDMIGRNEAKSPQTDGLISIPSDTTNRLNLIGSHYSPDYDRTVKQLNKWVGLDIDDRFNTEYALNTFFRSDQFPFVLQNIPAFWWFTGFHPDYHHTTDTADKINYVKMQKILRLAYLSAYAFANDAPPVFVRTP